MSIPGLTGLPGHGKSYTAFQMFIYPALVQGRDDPAKKRVIVTNIPLTDKVNKEFPDADIRFIDLDMMAKRENAHLWLEQPASALYVLDELWRIWPSGVKTANIPKEQLAFIKEHRHNIDSSGIEPDIVLVTQDLADIASAIRTMIETTIVCTKLTAVGAKGNFRRDYYTGSIKGFVGPKTAFIRSDQCRYDPVIFSYYKSHTKAQGAVQSIDNKGVVGATIFNGWGFKFGVGGFLFFLSLTIFLFFRAKSGFDKYGEKREVTPVTVPVAVTSVNVGSGASSSVSPAVVVSDPIESSRWRLVGHVHSSFSSGYVLVSDGQVTRRHLYAGNCKKGLELVCEIRGEIITRFSGPDLSPKPDSGSPAFFPAGNNG